ncbi:MAG: type IV pilus twitching motility protein PilT [Candidatus Xenobia bacterium]
MPKERTADDLLLQDLLRRTMQQGATDLHLSGSNPPYLRIMGDLVPLTNIGVLKPEQIQRMVFNIMTGYQNEQFIEKKELDFSFYAEGVGRFRVNVMFEKEQIGAVFRTVATDPYSFEFLGVPPLFKKMIEKRHGLILVTGPTGSGKSTTLAAMVNYLNINFPRHIITIEDPIEYMYENKKALIRQRELGTHTRGFADALRSSFRQDPDVILVGEMRDLDTISTVLTAAETGHLVLSTLHTNGAVETVNRVVDVFPAGQQQQVRMQLAACLEAIMGQRLLPKAVGRGMVMVSEVFIATPAARNIIREGRIHQLRNVLDTGVEYGMQTLDQSLRDRYLSGAISYEVALANANDQAHFKEMIGVTSDGEPPAGAPGQMPPSGPATQVPVQGPPGSTAVRFTGAANNQQRSGGTTGWKPIGRDSERRMGQ